MPLRWFDRVAAKVTKAVGRPLASALAIGTVVAWAITGPLFHYSQTWQLLINTGTTIVTFLMVFVIQHAQNAAEERDLARDKALHAKIDELITHLNGPRNEMAGIEPEGEDVDVSD